MLKSGLLDFQHHSLQKSVLYHCVCPHLLMCAVKLKLWSHAVMMQKIANNIISVSYGGLLPEYANVFINNFAVDDVKVIIEGRVIDLIIIIIDS